MQLQTLNLKTFFIVFLWGIVTLCALVSLYYVTYLQLFGYTKLWTETIFYTAMCFIAIIVVARFERQEDGKRFYKKQQEILHLFTENNSSISLHQILSKTLFSKAETKGILEHLVEKKVLIPSFSEEQELIYKLTEDDSLDKYLKKIH